MSRSFKVLARDGSESRPARPEKLYQWYREGSITGDSLISEKGTLNWLRLDAVFDVSTWDRPDSNETSRVPNLEAKPPDKPAWDDDGRTSGMLAAAILLFIHAVFSVVFIAFLYVTPTPALQGKEMVSPTFIWMSVPIMDLIVGAGLLRGKWQFRRTALILAVLGVVFELWRALRFQSPGGWIELVFQIVFAAGMFALLYGGQPSRERVFAGVVGVVIAWCGPAGGAMVDDYLGWERYPEPPPPRARFDPEFAVSQGIMGGMQIEDLENGFKLTLPSDWLLRPEQEVASSAPGTKLIASNTTAGCSAVLRIEAGSPEVKSLDDYLTRLVTSVEKSVSRQAESARSTVMIGDRVGRRLETSWTEGNTPFRGFSTVCRNGAGYFLLTGWCEESVYEFAFPAFQKLEAGFEFIAVKADPASVVKSQQRRIPRGRR